MWTATGAYLVFPKPFNVVINLIAGRAISLGQIPHSIHVGNFAGWPIKALWVVLGLIPPVLFVTGFIMWWHRVVQPWLKRGPAALRPAKPTLLPSANLRKADGIARAVSTSRPSNS